MSHVLIVEDDDVLRDLYSIRLDMEGFEVETARDGIEGLEKVSRSMPDIIILDMMMPRLDGMGFLTRFKENESARKAKVLVASNKSSTQGMADAKMMGAADYLVKARLTPDDLVEHVKKHLKIQPQ